MPFPQHAPIAYRWSRMGPQSTYGLYIHVSKGGFESKGFWEAQLTIITVMAMQV